MSAETQLSKPSHAELQLESQLHRELLKVIESQNISQDQIARVLGLSAFGAGMLLRRDTWPLATCLRVAEALHVTVTFETHAQAT